MKETKKYNNPTHFRRALEDRLKSKAGENTSELQRLRRQVSFDRLLARLFYDKNSPWILKGGYAMQLRLNKARATKDIDLAVRETKLLTNDPTKQNEALLEILLERKDLDLHDFFTFMLSGPTRDLDAAPYGGARFHIEARIDDRTFEKFHLDIGIGDVWIEPLEKIDSEDFLDFIGIPIQSYPVISKEQQFAEKLHAYTLPRGEGIRNSRVKDLVDMLLLINTNSLQLDKLEVAIEETFKRRNTHKVPQSLLAPPSDWISPFLGLAIEVDLNEDIKSAFEKLKKFYELYSSKIQF